MALNDKELEAFGGVSRTSSPPNYTFSPPARSLQPSLAGTPQFQSVPHSPMTASTQLPSMQILPVNQFGIMQPNVLSPQLTQPGLSTNTFQPAGGIQMSQNTVNPVPTFVQYPVVMSPPVVQHQQQPSAAITAAEIGNRYMAQQYAMCAVGNHDRRTKYGVLGIVCAVLFFPIGFICMFADVEETCSRCGKRL